MIKIKSRLISSKHKPFVIAELSGNHNGSLSNALKLVDLAAKSGVDAIKLQTFTAETITLKSNKKDFLIKDKNNPWKKDHTLFRLYKKAHTPWAWHKKIFDRAKKHKLIYFSSPFDETAVDYLEKLNVPIYKIASFENNHYPLLKKVAETGKPIIMSIGLSNLRELKDSVKYLKKHGCKKIALLKCTSSYPANPSDLNLKTIENLKKIFKCEIGFSDHSLGIGAAISAVALGACIIEKHFTLKKNVGVDGKFSSEINEMKLLKKECDISWKALGKVFYGATKNEINFKKYQRSIYISKNVKKNEKFSKNNIQVVRPSFGMHPKYYETILGKKSKKNLLRGTRLKKIFVQN